MKTCRECNQEKTLADFYVGHSKCKICSAKLLREKRQLPEQKEKRRLERRKAKESGKYKEWQARYESTEKGKERVRRYEQKRYQSVEGKARLAAKNAVKYATRVGKLMKEPCFMCGSEHSQAHHSSYASDMKLVVTWLCCAHHNEIHNEVSH